MSFKIPCGGFKLDENSFSLDENGVLSVSGGGGGVQPDWNQNDSTASDYIKCLNMKNIEMPVLQLV